MNTFKQLTTLSLAIAMLAACTASVRVMPSTDDVHRVVARDVEKHWAEKAAHKAAVEYCAEHGLEAAVTFAGFRPDVARLLHCIDLFAHPSVEEGLGSTILDAMAARLPVVASHAGGIPEMVQHGVTGWLVQPAAPTELAGPIISLLGDPQRRSEFGEAGRACVETEFSATGLCDMTLAAYGDVKRMSAAKDQSLGEGESAGE